MRVTDISCVNFTSHGSTAPEMGAAEEDSGVAASGMWPSPASSPEVGSSPTHPAPGRYTSVQACRSVKVLRRSRLAVERLHVGLQLNQIAGDEARRQSQMTQDFDQQPGAVAAGAASERQRLFAGLHARLHANQVAAFCAATAGSGRPKNRWSARSDRSMVFRYAASWGPAGTDFAERGQLALERRLVSRTGNFRRTAPGKNRTD